MLSVKGVLSAFHCVSRVEYGNSRAWFGLTGKSMDSGKTHSALLYKRKGRVLRQHFNLLSSSSEGSLDLLVSPQKNGLVTETLRSPAGCCSCSLHSALSSSSLYWTLLMFRNNQVHQRQYVRFPCP
ncbi:hypothetical protein PFLUV_G00014400 [Perca fluviatilis]|uniref:Uncharacterized protein n=1 Tax=Perca fluviatilis TaxID=8168 RepID=A0A6A5FSQ4_PERFL|nr:hypothetical protein PFLUV_G00014400 [Perca fluviatilis]